MQSQFEAKFKVVSDNGEILDLKDGVDVSDAEDLSDENVPYVLTDAGCYDDEDNDCAIVALALATNLPYGLIHSLAKTCLDRKDGTPTLNMLMASMLYPFKFRKINKKRCRLHSLIEKYQKGRFYIQIGGRNNMGKINCHALALINGKLYDRHIESPYRWVTGVWKIEGLKADSWWGWKKFAQL